MTIHELCLWNNYLANDKWKRIGELDEDETFTLYNLITERVCKRDIDKPNERLSIPPQVNAVEQLG